MQPRTDYEKQKWFILLFCDSLIGSVQKTDMISSPLVFCSFVMWPLLGSVSTINNTNVMLHLFRKKTFATNLFWKKYKSSVLFCCSCFFIASLGTCVGNYELISVSTTKYENVKGCCTCTANAKRMSHSLRRLVIPESYKRFVHEQPITNIYPPSQHIWEAQARKLSMYFLCVFHSGSSRWTATTHRSPSNAFRPSWAVSSCPRSRCRPSRRSRWPAAARSSRKTTMSITACPHWRSLVRHHLHIPSLSPQKTPPPLL